jgi:poly-gamma-glutamate synthesis protein (capsule biosynthesis protein)
LSGLSDKINADFNIGILPHIICDDDQKYADVLAPAEILDALKTAGFDDLLLNTEHALDQGIQGIETTVETIKQMGFSCGGVNIASSTQNRLLQLNSAKIAILAYTDSLTAKGKNALATQAGQNILTLLDLNALNQDIAAAKAQGANCIIVFVHWGKEDATTITKEQRDIAQAIADMGGDIIIGFHPSRVLPIEMLESRNEKGEARKALVAYSLGTLLTESRNGYDISGILLHLDITCSDDGTVKFNSVEYTPTYIWRQSVNGNMQYRVISSAESPPKEMDKNQQEVMGRALNRIRDSLDGSWVEQRK